jgi:hypothetical protein
MKYPFEPRSTAHLQPGQFWAIHLDHGRFACGRIVQLIERDGKRDSRIFLAGLSSWIGRSRPTTADLAGHSVIEQGQLHVKSIRESGAVILGYRPLELDGIRPSCFLDQDGGSTCMLLEGTQPLRRASSDEIRQYSVLSTWGYNVPTILAKKHFPESVV